MAKRRTNPIRILLDPRRVIAAVFIGLLAALWIIWQNFDLRVFEAIDWTGSMALWIFVAFLCIAVRDLAYMIRLRILTSGALSWKKLFEIIMLWEFGSSITPSVVGGTPIAIFLLNKEGISIGKSTTIVLITSLLDELFFIIMVPLLYLYIGHENLFPVEDAHFLSLKAGTKALFFTSYILIVFYCLFISYGIFINPRGIKYLLIRIFKITFLKRWLRTAITTGNEIMSASKEVKSKRPSYWIKSFLATYASWTARYWVVNCLILAFVAVDDHLFIYARQLVMWVIMLISPTPGGSGLAEYAFSEYLREFIPLGLSGTLALLWRLVSYYPYIIIGVIVLPRWVRRVFIKRKLIRFRNP